MSKKVTKKGSVVRPAKKSKRTTLATDCSDQPIRDKPIATNLTTGSADWTHRVPMARE